MFGRTSLTCGRTMAEERKPKIDLKARLGKASAGAGTPAPGVAGGVPVPVPPAVSPSRPPPAIPPPVVPGVPIGPPSPFGPAPSPAIDPSNPLAAVAAPYRPPQPPAPAQAQRIEVDEAAVQQARSSARKQAAVMALGAAVIFCGVGYVAGQASEAGSGRAKAKADAVELAGDVGKAKDQLKDIAAKLDAGRQALGQKKFPDTLAKDLGGIHVDFDGTKLAGRRFSGFPTDVTGGLVEFITGVQTLNDHKDAVIGLLTRLQKPLTEQFSAPPGQTTVNFVVAVDKDPAGNPFAILAKLQTPVTFTPPQIQLPADYTFTNPLTGGASKAPAYKGGDISRNPSAIYVLPKSFDTACTSPTASETAALAAQLGNIVRDINGEGAPQGDIQVDTKPGLLERADRLVDGLTHRVK